jgi:ABC-type transporter Mla subunit MlaD
MSKKVNKGNIVNGGTQYVGNQAIGDHARANWTAPAPGTDVRDLLANVEALLSEHEARLPEHAAASAELGDLKRELAAEQPTPSAMKRALDGLATFAKPVAPLVSAVAELAKAIHGSG